MNKLNHSVEFRSANNNNNNKTQLQKLLKFTFIQEKQWPTQLHIFKLLFRLAYFDV